MRNFLIIITILILTNSCKKEKFIDNAPQLEITVLDFNGSFIQGASVCLFESEYDWKNNINKQFIDLTNSNGIVLFEDLKVQIYYFYVEKSGMDNRETIAVIDKELQINVKARISTIIK